jgi:hypothetical protein
LQPGQAAADEMPQEEVAENVGEKFAAATNFDFVKKVGHSAEAVVVYFYR